MTAAAHTAGPHHVDGRNKTTQVGNFHLVWGGGELLAYVARRGDANLYAAAPELLEALEAVLREFEYEDRAPDQTAALYAASAAIAKAKETPNG